MSARKKATRGAKTVRAKTKSSSVRATRRGAKPKAAKSASRRRASATTRSGAAAPKRSVARKPAKRAAKTSSATRKPRAAAPTVAREAVAKKPTTSHGPIHSRANGLAPARRGSTARIAVVPHSARSRRRAAAAARPKASGVDRWTKQRLLFDLARARAAVHAAIRGLSADDAERPIGDGKWNVLEIILHLATRDQVRIDEMESVLLGRPVSWTEAGDEEMARVNEEKLSEIRHLGWEQSVALLDETRRDLLEQADSVPDDSEAWNEDHAFGAMMRRLPPHDVHHAEVIRSWRESQNI
jgi:uncharacterized damage-inducible protein DinB